MKLNIDTLSEVLPRFLKHDWKIEYKKKGEQENNLVLFHLWRQKSLVFHYQTESMPAFLEKQQISHTDMHIYIYIYVCVCVCVCVYIYVCVRTRMCACVCVYHPLFLSSSPDEEEIFPRNIATHLFSKVSIPTALDVSTLCFCFVLFFCWFFFFSIFWGRFPYIEHIIFNKSI